MWLSGIKKEQTDEKLVEEYFRTGDRALMGHLFEKHVKTVFGVCLFYFRDKEKAKDAVMQVFEKLISELRRSEVRNFKGWLSFVVRNHCLNEIRTSRAKQFVPEHYLDFEVRHADLEEEERIAAVKEDEMITHIRELLPQLKEKQRVCIEMFYLRQLSYEEVAAATGYSPGEVKSYIQNGKRNLKLMIESLQKKKNDAA
jgi:RNA polymerase sigma-70 factor (ECF subfamily)